MEQAVLPPERQASHTGLLYQPYTPPPNSHPTPPHPKQTRRYAGVLLGLSNTAGVLAGVLGTAATGFILQKGTWSQVRWWVGGCCSRQGWAASWQGDAAVQSAQHAGRRLEQHAHAIHPPERL